MTAYQIGSILFTLGMLYCFVRGAREAWPAVDDRNCNDDAPEDGVARGVGHSEPVDGPSESEAAQVFLYHGEPWFAAASIQALAVQLAFIAAVAVVCLLIGSEVWTRATRWIDAHPYWAGGLGTGCFLVATALGALRQIFIRLMARAFALPIVSPDGRRTFSYIGDVPPFAWQYSPWPRAGTWILVSTTSLVAAILGAGLIAMVLDGGFAVIAALLLMLRLGLSSILARLGIG